MRKSVMWLMLSVLLICSSHALAMDFEQTYKAMLKHSARYQAQLQRYKAERHGVGQARAGFLPSVSVTASYGVVEERNEVIDQAILGSQTGSTVVNTSNEALGLSGIAFEGTSVPFEGDYESETASITLQQSLLDREKWASYSRAKSQAKEAKYQLLQTREALVLELAEAYFGLLQANDVLRITGGELDALEKHKNLTQERHKEKLGTLTDVHEAVSRYQLVNADKLDALRQQAQFQHQLKVLTGEVLQQVLPIREGFAPDAPVIDHPDELIEQAAEHNNRVRLANQRVKTAKYELKRQNSNFLPTVSLRAQSSITTSTLSAVSNEEDRRRNQVLVQLEVPLFAGFGNYSSSRQAAYNLKSQKQSYREAQETSEQRVRNSQTGLSINYQRMQILKQAFESSQQALSLREQGYLEGLSSNLDLLDAFRDSYRTERAWRRALYAYVLSLLESVASIREIDDGDIQMVNTFLSKTQNNDEQESKEEQTILQRLVLE